MRLTIVRSLWALIQLAQLIAVSTCLLVPPSCAKAATAGMGSKRGSKDVMTWPIYANPEGRGLYIRIKVDGHGPYTFCVDTGSSVCTVDTKVAKQLKLSQIPNVSTNMSDGNSSGKTYFVSAVLDVVPGEDPFKIPLAVVDLRQVRCDGTIGMTVLSNFVLVTDGPHGACSLMTKQSFRPPKAAYLPLTLTDGAVAVPGTLDGRLIAFTIDTGSDGGISVRRSLGEKLGLIAEALARAQGSIYEERVYGTVPIEYCRLRRLGIGPLMIKYPIVKTHAPGQHEDKQVDAYLGWKILSQCRSVFDFVDKRLYLIPGPHSSGPMVFNRTGIWREGNRVELVFKNSPAERHGIRKGDLLVSLNGKLFDRMTPVEVSSEIDGDEGDHLNLTIRRGKRLIRKKIELREVLWDPKIPWPGS